MKLHFIKANPTENMTVFIVDPIPRSMYMEVAKKVMDYSSIHAEQVGFIEKTSCENSEACVRLHMMGGEFCANATRALAAVLVQRGHCKIQQKDGEFIVPLEVSGSEEIVYCTVKPNNNINSFISTAKIPLHKHIKDISINYKDGISKGTLVEFPGIVHLVVNGEGIDSKEEFFMNVKDELKNLEYEALGIMFYNEAKSYMEPLVYVKSTESLIWERGCGSGTAALGVSLSHRLKKGLDMRVKQPGGHLDICTGWNENKISDIHLKGIVDIPAEGIIYV